MSINLNCYNPLCAGLPRVSVRFRVCSDDDTAPANHDEFPLNCVEQRSNTYVIEKLRAMQQVENSAYVPRGSPGMIKVRTYQGELLISTRPYRYAAPPYWGSGRMEIFHSIRPPFIENGHSTPSDLDTKIRLITINDQEQGEDANAIDSVASLWLKGLTRNHRLLRLENHGAVEHITYYGGDLESALRQEFILNMNASSSTRRELLICLARCESIAAGALIDDGPPAEYDQSLLDESAQMVGGAMQQYRSMKFGTLNNAFGWSISEPVIVPLVSANTGKMDLNIQGYCYKLSREFGGPSDIVEWRVPTGLGLREASAWQLRQFLFEQCFRFGVDWQSDELDPYLSFTLQLQLFVPPDDRGEWVLLVTGDGLTKTDVASILTVLGTIHPDEMSDDFCMHVMPDTVTWKPLALKYRIRHEDLGKYRGMECKLLYNPGYTEFRTCKQLGDLTREPQIRFKLHIEQTSNDKEREEAFDTLLYSERDSDDAYFYPKTWLKSGFNPSIESDLRKSHGGYVRPPDTLTPPFERRRWQLTSILSAAVDYRYVSGDLEAGELANADIGMYVFQNFAAPTRFGKDIWFMILSIIALSLSFFGSILYWIRESNSERPILRFLKKARENPILVGTTLTSVTAINLYIFPYLPSDVAFLTDFTFIVVFFFILNWVTKVSRTTAKTATPEATAKTATPEATAKTATPDSWSPSRYLLLMSVITGAYAILDYSPIWKDFPAWIFGGGLYVTALVLGWTGLKGMAGRRA